MPKKIKTFDIALYLIPLIFVTTSVSMIYSLVFGSDEIVVATRQLIYALIGVFVMIAIGFVDYRFFRGTSWVFYLCSIILLIAVELFGKTVNGARNWLYLGFFQIQPSEVAKVFMVVYLSAFFSRRIKKIKWFDILLSIIILALPLVLILREPDLGTAIVICFVYFVILLASRPTRWQIATFACLIILISSTFFLSAFRIGPFEDILKDYQRNRILTFIFPNSDPYGSGYNVRQAQISAGAGELWGRGLGRGSQSQLRFLPEPHTDFIFAGLAESLGFLGSSVFLLLYLSLISKLISLARFARDNFGVLLSLGSAGMLFFQVAINVGMNLGIAPVTGIPLPLLSAGGTSLIMTLFLIGLVQSVFIRHNKLTF
ncbi:MAG: rod shape-determining protein RodA [Patescibacteria group bacterium]